MANKSAGAPAGVATSPILAPRPGILATLLQRGPRTWTELASAGLDRAMVLLAVGELVDAGEHRVRVGPLLIELEPREDEDA